MNKTYLLTIIGLLIILSSLIRAERVYYNAIEGRDYAKKFCKEYNRNVYKCFDSNKDYCEKNAGTDCANFVSQALIAGGINFSSCDINANYNIKGNTIAYCDKPKDLVIGAYNIGKQQEIKGLINALDLPKVLHRSYCFYKYKYGQEEAGDVVILEANEYHLYFVATDSKGASCTGEVIVCVPHNQNDTCIDEGAS